jgi:Putative MetA-pathway of phenol degradation
LSRRRLIVSSAGGAALGIVAAAAFAGHPMLSEDTGTQGRNNWELELGYAWIRSSADRSFLFQPQLSYGASPTLDLIVQPSWTTVDGTPGGRVRGLGDMNLDAKWRFYGAAPWSIGIRAGLALPTAQRGLGLPSGNVSPHAVLVATADLTPFAFDANLGYAYVPGDARHRPDQYHFSAAATYAANERLFLVLDVAADSNPDSDPGSCQAVALLGVIYTVRPGLDVDVGYRGRIGVVGPVHQWLLGITFRGAK